MLRRRLLLALFAMTTAGAAQAQRPPAPSHFVRTWDFGLDGEGEETCTVTLRGDEVIGGYGVNLRRGCRKVEGAAGVYAWYPGEGGRLVLADAARRVLFRFEPDPNYRPRGWGYGLTDAGGRLWIMNVNGEPPPPLRAGRRR